MQSLNFHCFSLFLPHLRTLAQEKRSEIVYVLGLVGGISVSIHYCRGGLGRASQNVDACCETPQTGQFSVLTSMEKLFITPKMKSSYRSDSEPSPEDKRLKESNSPAKISSDEDRVMEALEPKIDLVLSKLSNVEAKMEELNVAVKGLQSKVTSLEIEVDSVKTIQKALDDNFTSLERNTIFVDEQVQELTAKTYKNSNNVSNTRRKLLYFEAYSQRENLKFEGIPETFVSSEEDGAIQRGEASTENTKAVLTEFLQRVLGIEDAQSIEYQRVHRMGKSRKENGRERIIIARFLRFSD